MPAASVGRVSLKEHAGEAFRRALLRYADAAAVRGELARAVYDRPLDVTI
jgi:hypothetical protein